MSSHLSINQNLQSPGPRNVCRRTRRRGFANSFGKRRLDGVRQRSEDEWMLDPVTIADTYGASEGREGVDFVVDGGERLAYPSTVIDMTGVEPTVLRRGKGPVEDWMLMESHDSTEGVGVEGLSNPYA